MIKVPENVYEDLRSGWVFRRRRRRKVGGSVEPDGKAGLELDLLRNVIYLPSQSKYYKVIIQIQRQLPIMFAWQIIDWIILISHLFMVVNGHHGLCLLVHQPCGSRYSFPQPVKPDFQRMDNACRWSCFSSIDPVSMLFSSWPSYVGCTTGLNGQSLPSSTSLD